MAGEFAYLYPRAQDPMDTFWQAKQYQDRQALMEEQRALQQRNREDELMKWAASQMDFRHFATGTRLDPVINESLLNLQRDIAQKIKNGEGMASLTYDLATGIGKVNDWSAKAKTIRGGIEAGAKEFDKNSAVDAARLRQSATLRAFMKVDPQTGQLVPKSPDEIDDTVDYVSGSMEDALVGDGSGELIKTISGLKPTGFEEVRQTDKGGVKRKVKVYGELLPHEELVEGKNGLPTGTRFKSKAVKIGDQTYEGLDDAAYGELFLNPVTQAALNRQVRAQGYQPGTPEGEAAKQVLAYGMVSQYKRGGSFKTQDIEDRDAWLMKWASGITSEVSGGRTKKEKEPNAIEQLLLLQKGDLSKVPQDKLENGLLNITPLVKGGALSSGKVQNETTGAATSKVYKGVAIDPTTRQIHIDDGAGFRPVSPTEERDWLMKIAEANGVNFAEAESLWKQYNPGFDASAAQDAEQRLQGTSKKLSPWSPLNWFK